MIQRIVKLTFRKEEVNGFLENFDQTKSAIRGFDGCEHLELWRDKKSPEVFFTFSHWQSEEHLDRYRESELFKSVWAKTKARFSDKPKAWSVDVLARLD